MTREELSAKLKEVKSFVANHPETVEGMNDEFVIELLCKFLNIEYGVGFQRDIVREVPRDVFEEVESYLSNSHFCKCFTLADEIEQKFSEKKAEHLRIIEDFKEKNDMIGIKSPNGKVLAYPIIYTKVEDDYFLKYLGGRPNDRYELFKGYFFSTAVKQERWGNRIEYYVESWLWELLSKKTTEFVVKLIGEQVDLFEGTGYLEATQKIESIEDEKADYLERFTDEELKRIVKIRLHNMAEIKIVD